MRNKFSVGSLFYSEKFLVVFSVTIAFIIWVVVSLNSAGPETTMTIDSVPINVDFSESAKLDNLKVFDIKNSKTASITVRGNSLLLSKLKNTDIEVTAEQADSITKPGVYELALSAKKKSNNSAFTIVNESLNPQKITVTVDRYREIRFDVLDNIKFKTDPQYFSGKTSLDSSQVTISGPEEVVDKISKVQVDYTINETLKGNKRFRAPITIYDESGNKLTDADTSKLQISNSDIDVNIEVLKKATLPIKTTFINQPSSFNPDSICVITPNNIDIAGPEDVISSMTSVNLEPIDFSEVDSNNLTFDKKVSLPASCKNLSNAYTATVSINLGQISKKTISVNKFEFTNVPDNIKTAVGTNYLQVTIMGPQSQLDHISSDNVVSVINIADKINFRGYTNIVTGFKIDNADQCWVYGSYEASVQLQDKN
jgi:YbbR domain-containing protein